MTGAQQAILGGGAPGGALSAAWSTWSSGSASATVTPTLPASRGGRRVFCFFVADLTTAISTPPSNWTHLLGQTVPGVGMFHYYWRDCDGTSADTMTIVLSAAAYARAAFCVLTNADQSKAPEKVVDSTGANSTSQTGPAITPSWGAQSQIVFSQIYCQSAAISCTFPSGYSQGANMNGTSAYNGLFCAYKIMPLGGTEDPGTFTLSATPGGTIFCDTLAAAGF